MQEKHITVERTARYFQIGEVSEKTRELWFLGHGYGFLAKYFLWNFGVLKSPERVLVAPEGLSRYYQKGTSGRIGATWMTSEDRENEIRDYVKYLDSLYNKTAGEYADRPPFRVILLGFSQATATFTRWALLGKVPVTNLILWAGGLPPDVDYQARPGFFESCQLDFVYGTDDEYISPEEFEKQVGFLEEHNIPHRQLAFDGKHVIDPDTLKKVSQMLNA